MQEFVHDKLKPGRFLKEKATDWFAKSTQPPGQRLRRRVSRESRSIQVRESTPQHQVELKLIKFITLPVKISFMVPA